MKKNNLLISISIFIFLMLLFPVVRSVNAQDVVEIDFTQWWEPELPEGSLKEIVAKFEADNPNIRVNLVSGPYGSIKEQIVAGAATGTMSDVVGLDGAWIHDFVTQGAIANLSEMITANNYDASILSREVKIDGSTYMIPIVNFIYPLFINIDLLNEAGIEKIPSNRSEFLETAKAITNEEANVYGWVLPLSLENPNGVKNDIMSQLWASGGSMMKEGKPDLQNEGVKATVSFIKELYDAKTIVPGSFTMKEQDKVEVFTNARVGLMISSMAHINIIRDKNPDLNFEIAPVPVADGYSGKSGICSASWGVGIAENSQHKEEAWKFIEYLMSEEVNNKISTLAHAFPGNVNSVPEFVESDEVFKKAFEIFQKVYTLNEFEGLPVAVDLQRTFDEQFQLMLEGDQTVDEMLKETEAIWMEEF